MFSKNKINDGMEKHLEDAIELYSERQALYRQLTAGRSDALFKKLIASEQISLGVARYFDTKAFAFNRQGIPIVEADFIPMEHNLGFGVPIAKAKPLNGELQKQVRAALQKIKLSRNNFRSLANQCHETLSWINTFENQHQIYLPMIRHIIESIGFAALHAETFSTQSAGATVSLSRKLVLIQILAMRYLNLLSYDVAANEFHQQGIGILINDLPHIPFLEEYKANQTIFSQH